MGKGHQPVRLTPYELWASVAAWEEEFGVRVEYRILRPPARPTEAYVEVVVYDGHPAHLMEELFRQRAAIHNRDAGLWAGALCFATFEALNSLEATPWNWSHKMRKKAQQ